MTIRLLFTGGADFLSMRIHKVILSILTLLIACVVAYVSFMYIYTDHMFAPITLLETPHLTPTYKKWPAPIVPFIHKVNTPARAYQKDKKYPGFEVDVLSAHGDLLAAHDPTEAMRNIKLTDIFKAVKNPQEKVWWIDVKSELTDTEIDEIVQQAAQYKIPVDSLLFEVSAGPTAKRITQKGLGLLLPLIEGFDEDKNDATTRAQLNARMLALWEEYKPLAVSASFGKYAYLRAYFPNMPKAIYYSATQRPSIKKSFMRRHMAQDPSVKIFMTDEYSWINL